MLICKASPRMSTIARTLYPHIISVIIDMLASEFVFDCAVRNGQHPKARAGGNKRDYPHKDIEAASRVCKKWRDCALACSELWAYIAIPGTCFPLMVEEPEEPWWTWAEVLRLRSKERPLVMCIDLRFAGEYDHCQVIKNCLPRIKELCLHNLELSSDQHQLILDVLKENRAPRMEKFTLDMKDTTRRLRFDFEPGYLFCDDTPMLRWLTVKPGIRAVSPSVLSRLTRYTVLHRVSERTHDYDLHAQLSLMTSLEVLEIEFDSQHKLDWENRGEIHLERLQKIVIRGGLQDCEQFLSKMRVPENFWVEYPEWGCL